MHMTTKSSTVIESPNRILFLSSCLALVYLLAIADVVAGGLIRELIYTHKIEFALVFSIMIATVGVYASDGSPGLKFVRACSRHKL